VEADQIIFIYNIIKFLQKNGIVGPGMLFETPFTGVNNQGLLGVFDEVDAHKVICILERIEDIVGVA